MGFSFWLRLDAVDVLTGELGLPRSWQPFDIPHAGRTTGERARHRQSTWAELTRRGLAKGGRLVPDVENALHLWTTPDLLIVVRALQPGFDIPHVRYRAGAVNGAAVLSREDGDELEFDLLKADGLVGRIVRTLPEVRAVPLREVAVAGAAPREAPGAAQGETPQGAADPLAFPEDRPLSPVELDRRAAQRFLSWPLVRSGTVELSVRGADGRLAALATAQFHDTEGGRFLVFTDSLADGSTRYRYVPSDGGHLRRWLQERIGAVRAR